MQVGVQASLAESRDQSSELGRRVAVSTGEDKETQILPNDPHLFEFDKEVCIVLYIVFPVNTVTGGEGVGANHWPDGGAELD